MLEPHKESIDKNRPVYVEPEPETPDNDFEVERVVDSRINRWKKLEYQIEWKGFYGPDRTTWERADNIIGSGDEAIEEFYALNPTKPRQGDPYIPIRQRVQTQNGYVPTLQTSRLRLRLRLQYFRPKTNHETITKTIIDTDFSNLDLERF